MTDKDVREAGTLLAVVHLPMFVIVEMDVAVECALELVVRVECVCQNVAAILTRSIKLNTKKENTNLWVDDVPTANQPCAHPRDRQRPRGW